MRGNTTRTISESAMVTPRAHGGPWQDFLVAHAPVLSIAAFFVLVCLFFASCCGIALWESKLTLERWSGTFHENAIDA